MMKEYEPLLHLLACRQNHCDVSYDSIQNVCVRFVWLKWNIILESLIIQPRAIKLVADDGHGCYYNISQEILGQVESKYFV